MSDTNPFGWSDDEESKRPEEDDEDDLDDIPRKGESEADRQTRLDRKKERGQIFKALGEEKARVEKLERELSELRNGVAGVADYQQRANQPDPLDVQLNALDQERSRLYEEAKAYGALYREKGQEVPESVKKSWEQRVAFVENKKQELIVHKTLRNSGVQPAQQTQASLVMAEHTDVQAHPQAYAYADGAYRQLLAEGHQPSPDTLRLAMNKSRERFGLHKRPERTPGAADRGRFSGTRSAAAPEREDMGAMPADLKPLAHARYAARRDLTPEQKERLWWKEHKTEFRTQEAQRKGRR